MSRHVVCLSLIAALLLAGCGIGTVVNRLQTVVSAAQVALKVLFATGTVPVPVETQTVVLGYLKAVGQASADAADILAGTQAPEIKAALIVKRFGEVLAPVLPPGTPAQVAGTVAAVADAVRVFLEEIRPAKVEGTRATAPTRLANPSKSDIKRLQEIKRDALELSKSLEAKAKK